MVWQHTTAEKGSEEGSDLDDDDDHAQSATSAAAAATAAAASSEFFGDTTIDHNLPVAETTTGVRHRRTTARDNGGVPSLR